MTNKEDWLAMVNSMSEIELARFLISCTQITADLFSFITPDHKVFDCFEWELEEPNGGYELAVEHTINWLREEAKQDDDIS